MKQVKMILTVFALFVAVGIPQIVVAQDTGSSQSSYNIVGKWIPKSGDSKDYFLFKSDGTMILYSVLPEDNLQNTQTVPGLEDYPYKIKANVFYEKWELNGNILSLTSLGKTKIILGDNSKYSNKIQTDIWNDKIKNDEKVHDNSFTMKMTIISCTSELMTLKNNEAGNTVIWKRDPSMTIQQFEANINKQLNYGNPNMSQIAQNTGSSQSYNIVGKWILQDGSSYVKYNKDGTGLQHFKRTKPFKIEGTDIDFVVKADEYAIKWSLDGKEVTMNRIGRKIILGDNSYYPANIQKQIKEYKDNLEQSFKEDKDAFPIVSLSPDTLKVKFDNGNIVDWIRDKSGMTPQEMNQYKKDVANWNKKVKEKEDAKLKAKLAKENLMMAKLKIKALSSGNQYDYWIIGHMYEFGEGNDGDRVTICLDSALVWYKKATEIDPNNQRYVTALTYKMKTGGDYYKHKEQEEIKAAYNSLCKMYGKKYADDAIAGRITIGMPEALLIRAFKTKLVKKTASSKLYRVYGWGTTNLGTTISNNAHTQSVWVSNGKVSSVTNWQ